MRAVEVDDGNHAALGQNGHDEFGLAGGVARDMAGKAWTSATSWLTPVAAAAPHTPCPNGIRMHAALPWNGPSTSSPSIAR